MDALLLFFSTTIQVFMIAMQSIQIIAGRPLAAAGCASLIAVANVITVKMVPTASTEAILAYILANAIGVPLAMHFGQKRKTNV
jgi:predicted MFS family arabinose efflux permease